MYSYAILRYTSGAQAGEIDEAQKLLRRATQVADAFQKLQDGIVFGIFYDSILLYDIVWYVMLCHVILLYYIMM